MESESRQGPSHSGSGKGGRTPANARRGLLLALVGLLVSLVSMELGTARPQALRRDWNPLYYEVVRRFGDATSVPALLNTSFNLRGEPIVATPTDALHTFKNSGIDLLVMGRFVIRK